MWRLYLGKKKFKYLQLDGFLDDIVVYDNQNDKFYIRYKSNMMRPLTKNEYAKLCCEISETIDSWMDEYKQNKNKEKLRSSGLQLWYLLI